MCNESSEVNKYFCTHSYVRCANLNPSCFALALLYFLTIDKTQLSVRQVMWLGTYPCAQ
jgi:hypothetical protein